VVLAIVGRSNNESAGIVAVGPDSHVEVVESWERGPDDPVGWRVPDLDVEETIRQVARDRWHVREITADPYRWVRTLDVLEEEGLPVSEFPQSPQRMVPATQRFFEAVLDRHLTHDDDPRLARHIANCVTKTDARGTRLVTDNRSTARKNHLAVAAVIALERASVAEEPEIVPGIKNLADYLPQ
jgi:phage terminase large subunit-like protein